MSSPSRVRGGAPATIEFSACFRPQNTSGRKKNTILLPTVCVLANQIQGLLRTFRHIVKDFQGPCLFSRTFQALKMWKNYSGTFKDPQEPWKYNYQTKTQFSWCIPSGHRFTVQATSMGCHTADEWRK